MRSESWVRFRDRAGEGVSIRIVYTFDKMTVTARFQWCTYELLCNFLSETLQRRRQRQKSLRKTMKQPGLDW